jgi:hypothetical protein
MGDFPMTAANIAAALGAARCEGRNWRCRCPLHGGRSLTLQDGRSAVLVRCWAGCETGDVLAELRRLGLLVGRSNDVRPPRMTPRSDDADATRRATLAQRIWGEAKDARGGPVERYLRSRGITIPVPPSLRWMASCKHGPKKTVLPAVVAKVVNIVDELVAVHRIFLLPDGMGKAAVEPEFQKMSLGPTAGAAVRLGPLNSARALIVGEGIENTLSLMQLRDLPGWSAIGTSGLKNLILPRSVRRVLIAVDHDRHGKGEAAARDAAGRWLAEGRQVRLAIPSAPGDWNDVLQGACHV